MYGAKAGKVGEKTTCRRWGSQIKWLVVGQFVAVVHDQDCSRNSKEGKKEAIERQSTSFGVDCCSPDWPLAFPYGDIFLRTSEAELVKPTFW